MDNFFDLHPVPTSEVHSNVFDIWLATVLSTINAEFIAYPLDVTKSRLQIQGEAKDPLSRTSHYRGLYRTALGIVTEEGLSKLYSGFSAVIVRALFFGGFRLCLYDFLRNKLLRTNDLGESHLTVSRAMLSSIASGLVVTTLSTPIDLVRLQMQMESKRRLLGLPPRSTNLLQAHQQIYSKGGLRGFWHGLTPNMMRICLFSIGGISFYDLTKHKLKNIFQCEDNLLIQFVSSFGSGLASTTLSCPADVVKTRMMNQPIDEQGQAQRYRNSWHCFRSLVKDEGFFAMYRGFLPYWLRVGPWILIFWMSFECIRRVQGKPPF